MQTLLPCLVLIAFSFNYFAQVTFVDKRYEKLKYNFVVSKQHKLANIKIISNPENYVKIGSETYQIDIVKTTDTTFYIYYQYTFLSPVFYTDSFAVYMRPIGSCCAEYHFVFFYPKPRWKVYTGIYSIDLINHLIIKTQFKNGYVRLIAVNYLTDTITWARTPFYKGGPCGCYGEWFDFFEYDYPFISFKINKEIEKFGYLTNGFQADVLYKFKLHKLN